MLTSTSPLNRMVALNSALDRVLDHASRANTRFWVPAIDVAENASSYLIVAELPGVRRADLDIGFEHNVLTIRGTKRPAWEQKENEELRVYTAERATGGFERAVRLPEFVDADRIEARFDDGLLLIAIPKSPSAQPRKIEIRTT